MRPAPELICSCMNLGDHHTVGAVEVLEYYGLNRVLLENAYHKLQKRSWFYSFKSWALSEALTT